LTKVKKCAIIYIDHSKLGYVLHNSFMRNTPLFTAYISSLLSSLIAHSIFTESKTNTKVKNIGQKLARNGAFPLMHYVLFALM